MKSRTSDLTHISKIMPGVFGEIERRQTLTDAQRQEEDRVKAEEYKSKKRKESFTYADA